MYSDILNSLSLVYIFIFALAPVISMQLDRLEKKMETLTDAQSEEQKRFIGEKRLLSWLVCFPYTLLNLIVLWLCGPSLYGILAVSRLNFIEFDVSMSLFCVIWVLCLINTVYAWILFVRLLKIKIWKRRGA
ncbi:hypothetical protein AGMMS49587_18490 [Spirochaetia bacterium]|nr:hypothetical protein AGMMS49587_18490 [Spirochaetia bacterium]